MEFYIVCTDVETGKPVYHKYESFADHGFDWIRASASMPLVSQIVEIDGQKLLDGGIADAIPLQYFESIGYTRNVVILTHRHALHPLHVPEIPGAGAGHGGAPPHVQRPARLREPAGSRRQCPGHTPH